MGYMDIAFTIVSFVVGVAVLIGAWSALSPLRAEPRQPGAWLSVMVAGLACAGVATAGIVTADGGNGFGGTGDFALLGGAGILMVLGVALIASAIVMYEPDRAVR